MAKEALPCTTSREGNCVNVAWDFNKVYSGGESSAVAESDFVDLLDGSSLELALANLPCLSDEADDDTKIYDQGTMQAAKIITAHCEFAPKFALASVEDGSSSDEVEEEKKDDDVATAVAVVKPLPAHATIAVTAFGNHGDVESALEKLKEAAPQPQSISSRTSMLSSMPKGCNATAFGNHGNVESAMEELKELTLQRQAATFPTCMFSSVLKGCNATAFGNHGDVESATEELKEAAPQPQAASYRTSMFSSVLKVVTALAKFGGQRPVVPVLLLVLRIFAKDT
eukprot:gene10319-8250_t